MTEVETAADKVNEVIDKIPNQHFELMVTNIEENNDSHFGEDKSTEIRERAIDFCVKFENDGTAWGKKPLTVAAGAVYAAAMLENRKTPYRIFEEYLDVTASGMRPYYKKSLELVKNGA